MSAFVLVCVSLAAFVVACFAVALFGPKTTDRWGYMSGRFDWIGWVGVWSLLPLVICGIIALVIYPSRAVGRTTCRHWSEQTGYRTKFTILNWSDTGTCLTQLPDGRWLPNTHVIINSPERR